MKCKLVKTNETKIYFVSNLYDKNINTYDKTFYKLK